MAVRLDHAQTPGPLHEAVGLGFTSVMFDAAKPPYEENARGHPGRHRPPPREGRVGGGRGRRHGRRARARRPDGPRRGTRFVEGTGVDALAVAVGSSHAMVTRDAVLDFDLIARLYEAVPVPLVPHGSSGVADEAVRRAVAAGMRKENISPHLNKAFTRVIGARLGAHPETADPRRDLGPARDAVAGEITRLLRILAAGASAVARADAGPS